METPACSLAKTMQPTGHSPVPVLLSVWWLLLLVVWQLLHAERTGAEQGDMLDKAQGQVHMGVRAGDCWLLSQGWEMAFQRYSWHDKGRNSL